MKRLLIAIFCFLVLIVSLLLGTMNSAITAKTLLVETAKYYKCLILTPACERSAASLEPFGFLVLFFVIVSSSPFWFSLLYIFDSPTLRAFAVWKQLFNSAVGNEYSRMSDHNDSEMKDLHSM